MNNEPQFTADPEPELMPAWDPVPELMPATEPEPAVSLVPDTKLAAQFDQM